MNAPARIHETRVPSRGVFARLLRQFARLSPGGRIAISHQPGHPGATSADALAKGREIATQLEATGYTGVRIESIPLQPIAAVCVLAENPAK